jgi:hypothetical protein
MVHLAINEGDDQHDVVRWLQPVTTKSTPPPRPSLTERVHPHGGFA